MEAMLKPSLIFDLILLAVLLVSADLTELLQLSDSLIVMFGGEITAYFPDSSQVTDLMLGEYMLGVRRMSAEEIQEALQ